MPVHSRRNGGEPQGSARSRHRPGPDLPLRAIDADDPAETPAEPAGGARPPGPAIDLLAAAMNAVAV